MTHEGKAVHRHAHHAVTGQAVPVRPHEDALREFPAPDGGDPAARPHHPPRSGAPGCASDPAACAAANRAVLDGKGCLAVLIEGDGAEAAADALAGFLTPTAVAVIGGTVAGLPCAPVAGRIDARSVGLALDELRLPPASFLLILGRQDTPDLGQDLRIGTGADPAALAHVLMAALAGKAR